mmetsp:Transcript_100287/g.312482  ORF Transcript_100287/g.312482 Transcript_100287/m.312482 type:complete len:203 (+) Transcript_100287:49-657(+)
MADCTDHRAWVEYLSKEQTLEQSRQMSEDLPDEAHERCRLVNPYVGGSPFFARGLSHMFYNNSAKTRLLLAPHSEEPLTSRRHHAHILATRNFDLEKVPVLTASREAPPSSASQSEQGWNSAQSTLGTGGRAALPNSARGSPPHGATLRPSAQRPHRHGSGGPRAPRGDHRAASHGLGTPRLHREAPPPRRAIYGKMVMPVG